MEHKNWLKNGVEQFFGLAHKKMSFKIMLSLSLHCKEPILKNRNKYTFSRNFHIHVSVSDLYIPTIELPILLQEICGPILGKYKSLKDTWMEIGTEAAQCPRKGIHKWDFRCSVRNLLPQNEPQMLKYFIIISALKLHPQRGFVVEKLQKSKRSKLSCLGTFNVPDKQVRRP